MIRALAASHQSGQTASITSSVLSWQDGRGIYQRLAGRKQTYIGS
jgi:hypothetical protein